MQPISSFNDNLGTAIALIGPAGGGKTCTALRLFPRTYLLLADLNFPSAKRYLETTKQTGTILGYDNLLVGDDGRPIPANQRYDKLFRCVDAASRNPDIDCIVLDSGTFLEDIFKAKICNATSDAAVKLTGFDHWGTLLLTWKSLIMQVRQSGKKSVWIFHEKKEKDEFDQIFKYKIGVDGSIQDKLPALFSDFWRCEVTENLGKHTWNLRTLGNRQQEHLKNTFGLPAFLTQDEAVALVKKAFTSAQTGAGAAVSSGASAATATPTST